MGKKSLWIWTTSEDRGFEVASKGEKVLEGWERRDDIAGKENHKARAETEQNDPKAPGYDSEKKQA